MLHIEIPGTSHKQTCWNSSFETLNKTAWLSILLHEVTVLRFSVYHLSNITQQTSYLYIFCIVNVLLHTRPTTAFAITPQRTIVAAVCIVLVAPFSSENPRISFYITHLEAPL